MQGGKNYKMTPDTSGVMEMFIILIVVMGWLCFPSLSHTRTHTHTHKCENISNCTCLVWLVDWTPTWEPKGRWIDSYSGHMHGLQVRSPVGGTWEPTTHWCFSPYLSPSLSLSKNRQIKSFKNISDCTL